MSRRDEECIHCIPKCRTLPPRIKNMECPCFSCIVNPICSISEDDCKLFNNYINLVKGIFAYRKI